MTTTKLLTAAIAAVVGIGLSGCGEKPQVVQYKQGMYQGKKDTNPWDNAPYNGNKTAWETDIRTRNQGQNEYQRVQ